MDGSFHFSWVQITGCSHWLHGYSSPHMLRDGQSSTVSDPEVDYSCRQHPPGAPSGEVSIRICINYISGCCDKIPGIASLGSKGLFWLVVQGRVGSAVVRKSWSSAWQPAT